MTIEIEAGASSTQCSTETALVHAVSLEAIATA